MRQHNNNNSPDGLWYVPAHVVRACLAVLLIVCGYGAMGQETRYMLNGNSLYNKGKYKEAADYYTKALAKKPNYTPGMFNLGNSLYEQQKYDSSRKVMEATEKILKDKTEKASANYNIGNTYMAEKKWDDAIKSYEQTLRNNPQDGDARYNLSYAKKMKATEQQQQKDDKKKDKDKKDDKKDDKDKKDKDKKDDKKDGDKDKDKEEQPQPQNEPGKISKKTAEQILNALQNEEKKLQDKMKREKGAPVRPDKDW